VPFVCSEADELGEAQSTVYIKVERMESGKELGPTARCLHALVEQQATEVGRYGSGALYNTD
jgi:hypothetical protein